MADPTTTTQIITDRRAPSQACAPCKHDADIAVMKERDTKTQETLAEILACNKEMLKELGRITLVEHQILSHREDIERLYARQDTATEKAAVTEKRIDAWDNKIKAGWIVFAIAVSIVLGLVKYIASDIKANYDELGNNVRNLSIAVDSLDRQLQAFSIERNLAKSNKKSSTTFP